MTNKKFSTKRYDIQSQQLSLIFDLLRHLLKNRRYPGFRLFMKNMRLPENAALNKQLALMVEFGSTEWNRRKVAQRHGKTMSSVFPVRRTLKWAEYKGHALLALNSSELIIRVARFEAILKDIHRQALVATPQLLTAR